MHPLQTVAIILGHWVLQRGTHQADMATHGIRMAGPRPTLQPQGAPLSAVSLSLTSATPKIKGHMMLIRT